MANLGWQLRHGSKMKILEVLWFDHNTNAAGVRVLGNHDGALERMETVTAGEIEPVDPKTPWDRTDANRFFLRHAGRVLNAKLTEKD